MPIFDMQTSFTDVDIKQWLRRFPKERFVCKYDRWPGLDDINSFWPGDYEQFMKFL